MATLQDLDDPQMHAALSEAAERRTPAGITVRVGNRWMTLHSRLLCLHHADLWLEYPHDDTGERPHEFASGERLGLSFKLKHHKYLCAPSSKRSAEVDLGQGASERVLCVAWPVAMQRLQRRAYQRVAVPPGRIARAAFWPGGCEAEPAGTCPDRPVWSGSLTDLSAGGFQVRTAAEAPAFLETGFIMGCRLSFGADGSEGALVKDDDSEVQGSLEDVIGEIADRIGEQNRRKVSENVTHEPANKLPTETED